MSNLHREFSQPVYNYTTNEWETSFWYVDEEGKTWGDPMFFSAPNKQSLPKINAAGWTYEFTATSGAVLGLKVGMKLGGGNILLKPVLGGLGAVLGAVLGSGNEVAHVIVRDLIQLFNVEFNPQFEPDGSLNESAIDNILLQHLKNFLSDVDTIGSFISNLLSSLTIAEATPLPIIRYDPLTLDLNHNGHIDLISLAKSKAFFDLTEDGTKNKVGWVGGNDSNNDGIIDDTNNNGTKLDDADGFLVLDANNNGFFRKKNANSVFRKNEHSAAPNGRAQVVFKPQAQKSDEALLRSEQETFLNESNKIFLNFKEMMFCGNVDLVKNEMNDIFVNQNLKQSYRIIEQKIEQRI